VAARAAAAPIAPVVAETTERALRDRRLHAAPSVAIAQAGRILCVDDAREKRQRDDEQQRERASHRRLLCGCPMRESKSKCVN
jgi:hypothetical protein